MTQRTNNKLKKTNKDITVHPIHVNNINMCPINVSKLELFSFFICYIRHLSLTNSLPHDNSTN